MDKSHLVASGRKRKNNRLFGNENDVAGLEISNFTVTK